MNKFLILLIFCLSFSVYSLEIDKSVVANILETSKSKKTVLINRGSDHGLKVGDHAKMSDATGMFARAIVVKVSPSRSIWSIYRVFNEGKIEKNKVTTFKISSAIKLTKDESKQLGGLAETINEDGQEVIKESTNSEQEKEVKTPIKGGKNYANLFVDQDGRAYSDPEVDFKTLDQAESLATKVSDLEEYNDIESALKPETQAIKEDFSAIKPY